MSSERKRYYYLDTLKFIAIFLVCSYHFTLIYKVTYTDGYTPYTIFNRFIVGISSMCIPLFFMVNGALLLNHKIAPKKHLKKCITLFNSYIIWRVITIFFLFIKNELSFAAYEGSELLNGFLFMSNISGIDLDHLWFVPALLSVYLIAPLIKKEYDCFITSKKDSFLGIFMIILFVLCILLSDLSSILKALPPTRYLDLNSLIYKLNPFTGVIGAFLFYFILGGLFHKYIEDLRSINTFLLLAVFFIGAAMLVVRWYLETKSLQGDWDIVFNCYSSFPTFLIAASAFVLASKSESWIGQHDKPRQLIQTVGRNTLNIYYIHWLIGYIIVDYYIFNIPKIASIPIDIVKSIILVIGISYLSEALKKLPVMKKLLR